MKICDRFCTNSGDVQEFLKEMLEMYHYEETLMNSTTQAIHSDIHNLQLQLQKQIKKGYPVRTLGCGLCGEHLAKKCGKMFYICLLLEKGNVHKGRPIFCRFLGYLPTLVPSCPILTIIP